MQQSSARYYQRPDAGHLALDTTRTTLSGFGASLSGGKISGHFNFLGFSSWSSPGLEFNDIGYKPNADMGMNGVWGSYREWRPRGIVNQYEFNGSIYQIINFSGQTLGRGTESFAYIQFRNYYDIAAGLNSSFNGISTTLLRGGPSIRTPGEIYSWFSVESDSRKKFQAEYEMSFRHGFENSTSSVSYGLEITYKPNNRFLFSLSPQYVSAVDHQQYVRTVNGESPSYILSSIRKHVAQMEIRANYGITPDMSLQWYALPYLFSGNYSDFKTVTAPHAEKFDDRFTPMASYPYEDPDFHFLQFRSNLVYRWEYRPGSVLYLVWSQGKTLQGKNGAFLFNDYVRELAQTPPQNDFLVKLSFSKIF